MPISIGMIYQEGAPQYVIEDACRPFVSDFDVLKEHHGVAFFHDTVLQTLRYELIDDKVNILVALSLDGETEAVWRFEDVKRFESNIEDTRCTYFYGINFYIKTWFDQGKCIIMETDNDWLKIVAKRIVVLQ